MERQVHQLKINARNIESFLSNSNRTLRKHRQDQKKFDIRQTNIQKQKTKEVKIEAKRSPVKKSSNVIAGTAKKGARGIFGFLGSILDLFSGLILGNAVTNIENIADWFIKKNITFQSIFKSISDFSTMIADQGTKLLAMAVKLPEEFPDTNKETPKNKVKSLTTTNNSGTSDKKSLSEKLFPIHEWDSSQEGSDIINQMFGHKIENNNMFNHSLYNLDFNQEGNLTGDSDALKLMNNFNYDPKLLEQLYDSNLSEESIDYLHFVNQTILVE
jgi:hypothetical protein